MGLGPRDVQAQQGNHPLSGGLCKPPVCPYCGHTSRLVDDSVVYSRGFGSKVYYCQPCSAWVGIHRGSTNCKPLGRLANKELRQLKVRAHFLFDALWRSAMKTRRWTKGRARRAAYGWLAEQMGIPFEQCHIGMFDDEQTSRVITICASVHNSAKGRKK